MMTQFIFTDHGDRLSVLEFVHEMIGHWNLKQYLGVCFPAIHMEMSPGIINTEKERIF